MSLQNRATGAIMGAFVGDALGVGPHWYYDLEELREKYGDWIAYYTDPKPGHYHENLKAGQLSQSGIITEMLLRSVVQNEGYNEQDFCRRLDEDLFSQLDGLPHNGPGGYTSQSIREAWQHRVKEQKDWDSFEGHTDNTEAAERALVLSAFYAKKPAKVIQSASANCALTQTDEPIKAMTTAYCCVLALLVDGHRLDGEISGKLMDTVKDEFMANFASPDALLTPSCVARAAVDPDININPAWKVSLVYGMPCAIYHVLPAAYYLAAHFYDDFENAVLHAINGGGQNQARAILTGALAGAQVGLSGIPQRFLEGLENGEELVSLAEQLGKLADQ